MGVIITQDTLIMDVNWELADSSKIDFEYSSMLMCIQKMDGLLTLLIVMMENIILFVIIYN